MKIWNFSNGQCLKDLLSMDGKAKVDNEITALVSIHDPNNLDSDTRIPHFVGVGWDKTLHIWTDERNDDETINVDRDLPKEQENITVTKHKTDIMSCVYDVEKNLIFTGGHEGSLLAWHFETGFSKYSLHEKDKTCTSEDYVRESKSVDCLVIMQQLRLLMSGSSDGYIRFWDLNDLSKE